MRQHIINDDIDGMNRMYDLHKIPSDIPGLSIAEKLCRDLICDVDIDGIISAGNTYVFVDFFILDCLKRGADDELRKYVNYNLMSFYSILDGRTDFVDRLCNAGYSIIRLVRSAMENDDVLLLKYVVDRELIPIWAFSDIITYCRFCDMRQSFDYLLSVGLFSEYSPSIVVDTFVLNDNLVMIKWMDRNGFMTKYGNLIHNIFKFALVCESIKVAKWFASHGYIEYCANVNKC